MPAKLQKIQVDPSAGYRSFQLFGFDFMLDATFKVRRPTFILGINVWRVAAGTTTTTTTITTTTIIITTTITTT